MANVSISVSFDSRDMQELTDVAEFYGKDPADYLRIITLTRLDELASDIAPNLRAFDHRYDGTDKRYV
jgi:hypothetical protein